MNHLFSMLNKKGFATLIPVIIISGLAMSFIYTLEYRMRNFEHALYRYQDFLVEKYKKESCENLSKLYSSFDPFYKSSQENTESGLIIC